MNIYLLLTYLLTYILYGSKYYVYCFRVPKLEQIERLILADSCLENGLLGRLPACTYIYYIYTDIYTHFFLS